MDQEVQLISPSAAKAATKYSRLVEAARYQPSALSVQLLNEHCEHAFDFGLVSAESSLRDAKKSRWKNL